MQSALVHSELHVWLALGLSADIKNHIVSSVCDEVLESYISQQNNVSGVFFAKPHTIMVDSNYCLV